MTDDERIALIKERSNARWFTMKAHGALSDLIEVMRDSDVTAPEGITMGKLVLWRKELVERFHELDRIPDDA